MGFQIIQCLAGWVRVVYEDQGEPFVMHPGDLVLQPPTIRHRVLESSDGLEVLEVSSPAEHPTRFDHYLALPTPTIALDRAFGGQRFVRHQAHQASWVRQPESGWEAAPTEVASATAGISTVQRLRSVRQATPHALALAAGHSALLFAIAGSAQLSTVGTTSSEPAHSIDISEGDAVTLDAGVSPVFSAPSADFDTLIVTVDVAVTAPETNGPDSADAG